MAQCLTWKELNQAQTNECLEAVDLDALRPLLKRIDEARDGEMLYSKERSAAQISVLLELYGHLILFCKASQFSPFKTSTAFGIVRHVHESSMAGRLTRAESYDLLRQLVVQHSVHRPPYSTMIFNIREVQDMDTYLMSTYYRHYKMYVYCFVPREIATLRTVLLNDVAEIAPAHLPSLSAAISEDAWKAKMQEKLRLREEAEMEDAVAASEVLSSEQRAAGTLDSADFKAGVRVQLEQIRDTVTKHSGDRLDMIEEKLAAIETKVSEMQGGGANTSKAAPKKKK